MAERQEVLYWEKILGTRVWENIQADECAELKKRVKKAVISNELLSIYHSLANQTVQTGRADCFENFYFMFEQMGFQYFEKLHSVLGKYFVNAREQVINNIYWGIGDIPARCLIQDIHVCRESGLLRGADAAAEYQYYNEHMLGNTAYVQALCDKYPELLRLLLLKIEMIISLLAEIVSAVIKDKERLVDFFPSGNGMGRIASLTCGLSDSHQNGKTVAKIVFEGGNSVFYKPHGLHKEILYQNAYRWFCGFHQLAAKELRIIDGGTYGWEECVEKNFCRTDQQVQRFFYRLGLQLFLCYLTGASDLHGENIIADGEHPVIVDFETFPGAGTPADDFLKNSVLRTGILPQSVWDVGGRGSNISAIHQGGKIKTAFQVPVIHNKHTSDICISYRPGEADLADSLPKLNGEAIRAEAYTGYLCQGFADAYQTAHTNKEVLMPLLRPFFETKSRCLLRHTQQYSMFLSTSWHPDFMGGIDKRILLMHVLKKSGDEEKAKSNFFAYEAEALLNGTIPIFYRRGGSRSLYAGDGSEYPDYFTSTTADIWQQKMAGLSAADLLKQTMLIELSMQALSDSQIMADREMPLQDTGEAVGQCLVSEQKRNLLAGQIADRICSLAVSGGAGEINWVKLQYHQGGSWAIEPLTMNLYDGISGVAVFLATLPDTADYCDKGKTYQDVFEMVCRKMFAYTDQLTAGTVSGETGHTGAFAGESSIVYAYLLLYRIRREERFLEYARKHCRILAGLAAGDSFFDLISGNAGAVLVLVKLYEATLAADYLELAVQIGEILWGSVTTTDEGCGFKIPGESHILAGMSHGSSGFILAYAYLLEHTGNELYIERIKSLLAYENSQYDPRIANWRDMRQGDPADQGESPSFAGTGSDLAPRHQNTWCHGAAGILLSRLKLYTLTEFQDDGGVLQDIWRGINILKNDCGGSHLCLCHGLAGNYLIIKHCSEIIKDSGLTEKYQKLQGEIANRLAAGEQMVPAEKYGASFMTGLAGIGYALSGKNQYPVLW